jgi:RNA polymerase sigma factor (sigma-70 family)
MAHENLSFSEEISHGAVYFDPGARYLTDVPTLFDQWFAEQILSHEVSLTRYLHRVWPVISEIPDLRQDIYVRVYEHARQSPPTSPRAFLFATARNLLADHMRRKRVVSIEATADAGVFDLLVDDLSPERQVGAAQELQSLARAFDSLSDKCRSVVWLRRIEGLSQRDTAERLGLREAAVESQLARGMRALARAVFGSDDTGSDAVESSRRGADDDE